MQNALSILYVTAIIDGSAVIVLKKADSLTYDVYNSMT